MSFIQALEKKKIFSFVTLLQEPVTMRFIALLCLGVTLCAAMPSKQTKHHLKKRQAEADLCDSIEGDVVPSWMTVCEKANSADAKVCIFTDFLCDGEADCPLGEDEEHEQCGDDEGVDLCSQIDENGVVPFWMRVCEDQAKCIFADWVCDGEVDCFDGSDEQECGAEGEEEIDLCEYKGEDWLGVCDSGNQCYLKDWECDLEQDCDDGSDEKPSECQDKWLNFEGGYRAGKK